MRTPVSRFPFLRLLAAALPLVLATAARAAGPELLGTYGEWEAYTAKEAGKTICYMGAEPQKAEGKYTKRGRIYLLVTHRPADDETGIISITTGYSYKEGSAATAAIDGRVFKLFTQGENAFAHQGEDPAMVKAMIQGKELVVKGQSSRGTLTTDTYSLSGFTAAWRAIGKACKVK